MAVGEGRGLPSAVCGKGAALGDSIKAARGVEASLTQLHRWLLLFSACSRPGPKAKGPLPPLGARLGQAPGAPCSRF